MQSLLRGLAAPGEVAGARSRRSCHGSRMAAPALLLAAWALLLSSWVMANAPFAAPDEAAHFVRAVGVSEGQLIGAADPRVRIGVTPVQVAWTAQAARLVSLPAGFDPQPFTCDLDPSEPSAACLNTAGSRTPAVTVAIGVGNYQPLPYLLPAMVLRAGKTPAQALRLARAAQALTAFALLAVAVFALYDAASPLVSLLGLMLAATPMVLFCSASLNGSGLEITGGVAFSSCLLRVARPGATATRWWMLMAVSGAALALSRSASPAWLILALLAVAWWSGPCTFAHRLLAGWAPRATVGALVLAVVLNRVWEALYGSRVPLDTVDLHAGLIAGVREWWRALPDLVGKFGYLDVKLPLVVPLAWLVLVLALWATACAMSMPRQRLVLVAVLVGALLVGPVLFYALLIRPTGFGLQGRHVLPIVVALPLLAGEALNRSRGRVPARWLRALAIVVPVAVAAMQLVAWFVDVRRYAVGGSGAIWFLDSAAWSPPAGWWTWLAATALAGMCIVGIALCPLIESAPLVMPPSDYSPG